ncbi:MAG TPA: VWA domain-containing protein [Kofleriaceae bacterium]|nr:VWA domain-containing protein [Kofleriaceae bacterium]
MKLFWVWFVVGSAGAAHARGAFEEYGAGIPQRPAEQLREASCEIDVELRGAVAVVEQRQRIANPSAAPLAASLEQELPAGAQVTGLSLREGGAAAATAALPVDAESPSLRGAAPGVDGVDPAFGARLPGGGFHVILQPITPGRDVLVTTRYVAPALPRAGGLRLVLPGRASEGGAAPCKGTVRATPGPGATVRKIRVGSAEAAGAAAPLALGDKDVAIHVELAIASAQPLAWVQTQPLADGWSASLVTVLGPPQVKSASSRRVVFVIDGSRSMDLVGRHHVTKLVSRIGAALPAGSEVEAILYDRSAARVFGDLRPATAENLAAIEAAVGKRAAQNGSDLPGALALAKQAMDGARGQSMLVIITDGVTGDVDGPALVRAIGAKSSVVDVHAIVIDPGRTTSPGAAALRAPVNVYGGAYVEVPADQLDEALSAVDEWLRPAWLELALGGHAIPSEVRAGGGFARPILHRGPARFALTGHGEAKFTIAAAAAPTAPVAALALAGATAADFAGTAGPAGTEDPTESELILAEPALQKARAAHPFAGGDRALAVLAAAGRIAKSRRDVVAGGGRYERVIALDDPKPNLVTTAPPASRAAPSAIARETLERMFREQLQPKVYVCYQRALGRNASLAGTVYFQLRMGRGEVTEVSITGLGDPQLEACMLDAAYLMTPPLPDFSINTDDQTIANYPLTLQRRAEQTVIVLGDADSQSPIDIDAVEPGVGGRPRKVRPPDASTPLGNLRPSKSP